MFRDLRPGSAGYSHWLFSILLLRRFVHGVKPYPAFYPLSLLPLHSQSVINLEVGLDPIAEILMPL
jgi:hypothetical protein